MLFPSDSKPHLKYIVEYRFKAIVNVKARRATLINEKNAFAEISGGVMAQSNHKQVDNGLFRTKKVNKSNSCHLSCNASS